MHPPETQELRDNDLDMIKVLSSSDLSHGFGGLKGLHHFEHLPHTKSMNSGPTALVRPRSHRRPEPSEVLLHPQPRVGQQPQWAAEGLVIHLANVLS